jgi:hypothetical protein
MELIADSLSLSWGVSKQKERLKSDLKQDKQVTTKAVISEFIRKSSDESKNVDIVANGNETKDGHRNCDSCTEFIYIVNGVS